MEEREEGGDGFRTVENLKEIAFTENYIEGDGSGPVMTTTGRKCLRVVPMVVQKKMDLKSTVSEDDDGGKRSLNHTLLHWRLLGNRAYINNPRSSRSR
ncbi:hypothetical protein L2E82_20202 [Cichorium intybus]|uniref:Uncharacterized protein n=1 Tax=Cichorium intybus TaxID=13427 RepID=A0ACB9DSC6_CICIN|nr:hypothetical protein L2E82_20202 [Cichorium intybus]